MNVAMMKLNKGFIFDRRKYKWRKPMKAIPGNCFWFFNFDQVDTYLNLKAKGWKLYFIRRPRLRKQTIAMIDNAGIHAGLIRQDGSFDKDPTTIKIRSTT